MPHRVGQRRPEQALAAERHNLPASHTRLIGREHDSASVRDLVLQAPGRLVTLTGTGGCGKTQLALEAAAGLVPSFTGGVWFVDLAPLRESALVPYAVAAAVGCRERAGLDLVEALVAHLARHEALVVLDNCEHLIEACALLAERLLDGCPHLRLLATSREPLRLPSAVVWPVAPLVVPDLHRLAADPGAVAHSPAVQLFVERARAVRPSFNLTPSNATAVAQICVRLEGLPLALELAAARVRALAVQQIAARLDDMFRVLADAGPTAPDHQHTLRATLDWSAGLLGPTEHALFRRLAIFVGGWTLEAAEAVCADAGIATEEVLKLLARLVDRSLVIADEVPSGSEAMRYRLLEPTRQYTFERLQASGELDTMRGQHAAYYYSLAEQATPHPQPLLALEALGREHDNVRAALRWVIDHGEGDLALCFGAALCEYWCRHGFFYSEGRRWLQEILALPPQVPNQRARALMLVSAGIWAGTQGDRHGGRTLLEDGLALARDVGDQPLVTRALNSLGSLAEEAGDLARARALLNEALATSQGAGEPQVQVYPLLNLGRLAWGQGDHAAAGQSYEAARAIASELGDAWLLSAACLGLGDVARAQGQLARAQALYEAALAARHIAGDHLHATRALAGVGHIAAARGDYVAARRLFGESLVLEQELGSPLGILQNLEAFVALAVAERRPEVAARLAGAAAAWRLEAGLPASLTEEREQQRCLAVARRALGEAAYATEWAMGQAMAPDDAIALATHAPDERAPAGPSAVDQAAPHLLSAREQEVAALVAGGLSNRQIASRLVITERTAGAHVEHILAKLGFASRTQIGVWAAEHGLVAPHPS